MDNDLHTSTFGQPEEKILYGYNNINDDDDRRLRRRTGPDFVRRRRFRTIRRRARLPDRVWSIEGPNAAVGRTEGRGLHLAARSSLDRPVGPRHAAGGCGGAHRTIAKSRSPGREGSLSIERSSLEALRRGRE